MSEIINDKIMFVILEFRITFNYNGISPGEPISVLAPTAEHHSIFVLLFLFFAI